MGVSPPMLNYHASLVHVQPQADATPTPTPTPNYPPSPEPFSTGSSPNESLAPGAVIGLAFGIFAILSMGVTVWLLARRRNKRMRPDNARLVQERLGSQNAAERAASLTGTSVGVMPRIHKAATQGSDVTTATVTVPPPIKKPSTTHVQTLVELNRDYENDFDFDNDGEGDGKAVGNKS